MLDEQQCPPPFMFAHQRFPSHIQTLAQTLVFSADACTITYCTCMSMHIKKKKLVKKDTAPGFLTFGSLYVSASQSICVDPAFWSPSFWLPMRLHQVVSLALFFFFSLSLLSTLIGVRAMQQNLQ